MHSLHVSPTLHCKNGVVCPSSACVFVVAVWPCANGATVSAELAGVGGRVSHDRAHGAAQDRGGGQLALVVRHPGAQGGGRQAAARRDQGRHRGEGQKGLHCRRGRTT